MADLKVLLQAVARPWFIDPVAAKKYAGIIAGMFDPKREITWSADLIKPVSKDFVQFIGAAPIGGSTSNNNTQVALINLQGAVMKYDYCGAPGTQSLMNMIDQVNAMPNVKAIILQIDSPGGAVDGTQQLADKIKNSKKPVVAFVNGMMASAAMWFGSSASYRIASSNTDFIGSIGTLCTWDDFSEQDALNGIKVHEVYATASTEKNLEFREASGAEPNYQPLIENILDPINNEFISTLKSNMPKVNEAVFTGKIYIAKTALEMGLIDKIGTLQDAINHALSLASKSKTNMETKTFTHVQSITGQETLEQLNEGIWLTVEQVEKIDTSLGASFENVALSVEKVTALETALTAEQSAKELIEEQLIQANARITELEAIPTLGADTASNTNETDEPKKNKYLTSVDKEAEEIRAKYR
jgi:protease-4